jgi:hypothetical protein
MAPRDPWADSSDAVERIRLLTDRGFTVAEIVTNLRKARIEAPRTSTGEPQRWTPALVGAGQEYIRRRAAGSAPASEPEAPAVSVATVEALRRYRDRVASMDPEASEAWRRSAEGRAALRHANVLAQVDMLIGAVEGGQAAAGPRLVDTLARMTDTLSAGHVDEGDPSAMVADVTAASIAALEALPALAAVVGRDAILAALGLRERHVDPA